MIANAKRSDMHSSDNFADITKEFNPSIPHIAFLEDIVEGLRVALIDDHKESDMTGAKIIQDRIPVYNNNVKVV
ncbi:hypothetical protein IWW56_006582, partial [Coemansia sp. RSA 2131]